MQTRYAIWFGFLVALDLQAMGGPLAFQSSENRVALLELFTSEGCSSCPPAETWLTSLKDAPGLWREFVPVSFHVDYWDYLGWRDPWASKAFSNRQRDYAQSWHTDSIYTPGFVLNGQEWRSWSGTKNGPRASTTKTGVLQVNSADGTHWQVAFSPAGRNTTDYEVHAAILANEVASEVKSGENRGRRLHHDFVVTALASQLLASRGDRAEGELVFRNDKQQENGRRAIAFWVTHRGTLEPLQALGGWLSN